MKVNFKNTAENLFIIIPAFIVGGIVGYYAATAAIGTQKELIQQAIDKNTSEISNTFQNEFKKVKNKKGEPINIIIDPSANSVISDADSTQAINVDNERKLFGRWRKNKRN